jgi:hypothetical protein
MIRATGGGLEILVGLHFVVRGVKQTPELNVKINRRLIIQGLRIFHHTEEHGSIFLI